MKQRKQHENQAGSRSRTARKLWNGGLVILTALALVIGGTAWNSHRKLLEAREQAVEAGTDLIESTYISRVKLEDSLMEQALAYEWPEETVDWAMGQLADTDWKEEAHEAALDLGSAQDLSEKALANTLSQLGFTSEEADSALDQVADHFDYDSRAVSSLKRCAADLDGSLSRVDGRNHLEEALFTETQVRAALESEAVDWQNAARKQAQELLEEPLSEKALKQDLAQAQFTSEEVSQAVNSLDPDFDANCGLFLKKADPENRQSLSQLKQQAAGKLFKDTQIEKALESRDFRYNAVRLAEHLTNGQSQAMSGQDLLEKLKSAGFTQEEGTFVLKYYDESTGEMPGESDIREKIQQEEEAKKKAEEEARKKAEEEQRRAQEAAQKAANEAAAAAQAPSTPETNGATVWIPRTGSKYHSNPNCSNMKNPSAVTIDQALAWGYDRCKKCW